VIPPGLEANYRKPDHRPVRRNPTILTVAGVVPSKGLMKMLGGLETSLGLDWRWEIVGDTQLDAAFYREFRDCLDRSPVRDRIGMRGALPEPEVAAAYDRCDVFALPSRFETCAWRPWKRWRGVSPWRLSGSEGFRISCRKSLGKCWRNPMT
jgi:glycosyltransferase involved in cell wall biosynthesis